jgi:hypothetical protein
MFPSFPQERMPPRPIDENYARPFRPRLHDCADLGGSDSANRARDSGAGASSEKQFVVFAAMKSIFESRAGKNGEKICIDLGGNMRFGAEMVDIGGKAVTDVDGGCRCVMREKP